MLSKRILAAGDSHVRFWAGHYQDAPSVFTGLDILWVGAATAFNVAKPNSTHQALTKILGYIKNNVNLYGCVILCFGEIDCRVHVIRQAILNSSSIEEEIHKIVNQYKVLIDSILDLEVPVLHWGPPPTGGSDGFNHAYPLIGTMAERNVVTQVFHRQLKDLEKERPNFRVFTIFDEYVDSSLKTNLTCLVDSCHLSTACLPLGEAALRKALIALHREELLQALIRDSPVDTQISLRNIADGASYQCSSIEEGTPVSWFSGEPSAGNKFHTKLEKNPWILMDFEAGFLIQTIVIYNRSDFCQDRAETIQIEGSIDGVNFDTLYAPECSVFYGVWHNRPLVVEVQAPKFYRYLRFSLRAETYFHLDFIQVFAPSSLKSLPLFRRESIRSTSEPIVQDNGTSRPLNILYVGCHEILEYDDLMMFTQRGHRVFSLGDFAHKDAHWTFRKPDPSFWHAGDWEKFCATGGNLGGRIIPAEFAKQFDVAIFNHYPEWITQNINALNGIPIIYRSLGQSDMATENRLRGVENRVSVVRYAERERSLPGFVPCDDVIYFGKFLPNRILWSPGQKIITFHNAFVGRGTISAPPPNDYTWLASYLNMDLYGGANDPLPNARGLASPEQQAQLYANAAAYFYVYTTPPSYTLSFLEALATGTPIMAPSAKFIASKFKDFDTNRYEIPDLLRNDERVLYDTIGEAHDKLVALTGSQSMSHEISQQNFAMAQERFDATKIVEQWEKMLVRVINEGKRS